MREEQARIQQCQLQGPGSPEPPRTMAHLNKNMLTEMVSCAKTLPDAQPCSIMKNIISKYVEMSELYETMGADQGARMLLLPPAERAEARKIAMYKEIFSTHKPRVTEARRATTTGDNIRCFKCNRPGHYSNRCTYKVPAKGEKYV